MKKIKQIIGYCEWIAWRLTGYSELTQLLRSHTGNHNALTPTGLDRMEKLGIRESAIIRKMKGIGF